MFLVILNCGLRREVETAREAADAIVDLTHVAKARGVSDNKQRYVTVAKDGKHVVGPCAMRYAIPKIVSYV